MNNLKWYIYAMELIYIVERGEKGKKKKEKREKFFVFLGIRESQLVN